MNLGIYLSILIVLDLKEFSEAEENGESSSDDLSLRELDGSDELVDIRVIAIKSYLQRLGGGAKMSRDNARIRSPRPSLGKVIFYYGLCELLEWRCTRDIVIETNIECLAPMSDDLLESYLLAILPVDIADVTIIEPIFDGPHRPYLKDMELPR
ncbi:hypothetical protein Pfo_019002 [Paulownia fortunei]|nr:hypothetical protein Pfo_019002 [Paulownia fortunei]